MSIFNTAWATFKTASDYWAYVSFGLLIVAIFGLGYLWFRGILPVLYRLGLGLAKRNIAIFAKGDTADSLSALLTDSKLFRLKNLTLIRAEGDIAKAAGASVFIVHWPDWVNSIEEILAQKRDSTALIVYAPPGHHIPPDILTAINNKRNATLVNLRGRLMNDVVLSMITTSYEKK